jgi:hypothetical protein
MQEAKEKYGDKVYDKIYINLQHEFGGYAFPDFLTCFRGLSEDPITLSPDTSIQLSDITECFCYAEQTINVSDSYFQGWNSEQLSIMQKFADIFRYDDEQLS